MHLKPNCDAIKFGVEPSKKAPVISVTSPATKVDLENVAGPKVHISGCRDKAKEEMQLRSPPQPHRRSHRETWASSASGFHPVPTKHAPEVCLTHTLLTMLKSITTKIILPHAI